MANGRATAPIAPLSVLILALVLSAALPFRALAQPDVPLPPSGQVIAHGIDTLPGTSMSWRLGMLTASPGAIAEFGTFDTGFAVGYQQSVLTTQLPSGESDYLGQGQALFHANGSTLRVASASGMAVPYLDIALTTDAPDPGASWSGDAFTAPAGTHAIRLTSDSMKAGETGTFVPDNDLPYVVYVFAGALQITDDNGIVIELMAEGASQITGTASLLAGTGGAHWMIASIGPQVTVPPMPTSAPTPTPIATPPVAGAVVISLFECPEGSDPLVDTSPCIPATFMWDIALSQQGVNDPTTDVMLLGDGVARDDGSWVIPQMATGIWVVRPEPVGANMTMRVEILGDVVPLGGIWGVQVNGGQESELAVYLIGTLPTAETGTLTIEMYDCPPGVDPLSDPSACSLASNVPNVEVSRITQSEMIIYNTLWDAVSPQAGVFILEDIETGLFMVIPDETGIWPADEVVMGGDAYWDYGFWQVSVPIDTGSAYVAIYHTPAGPPEPTQVTDISQGLGQLWITQVDCPPGTGDPLAEPGCMPSEAPWDVTVTNANTGETWTLYANATLAMTGSWEFTLPAGNYLIDVSYDPSWGVIYETFASVTEGGLTEVVVYSIAPDEP